MRPLRGLLALLLLVALLAGCSSQSSSSNAGDTCQGNTRASLGVPANHSVVELATDQGCIVAELFDDKAPVTVHNFLNYTREGFYNDTLFHRISKEFVLQGGGVGVDGKHKAATHAPIKDEAKTAGLHNAAYTFSMARMSDPNSATSEFFINVKDNGSCLDAFIGRCDPSGNGYAVFAKVVKGTQVVDKLHALPVTTSNAHPYCISLEDSRGGSCPVDPVILRSARVLG